jgi:hypothetical protein
VGLNVRRPPAAPALEPPPAYLSDATPGVVREDVLAGILGAMDALVTLLERPDEVARAWEERAGLRGRPYRLRLDADGSILAGTAQRLGPDGGLVVLAGGREQIVHLADARVV